MPCPGGWITHVGMKEKKDTQQLHARGHGEAELLGEWGFGPQAPLARKLPCQRALRARWNLPKACRPSSDSLALPLSPGYGAGDEKLGCLVMEESSKTRATLRQ